MPLAKIKVEGVAKLTTTLFGRQLLDYIAWQPVHDAGGVALATMRGAAPRWEHRIHSALSSRESRRDLEILVGHTRVVPLHATFMEHGTGVFRLDEKYNSSPTKIKFPSVRALEPWAYSKGLEPFLVARGIFNRGGLKPRMYVRAGENAARNYIDNTLPSQFNTRINFEL
jgi:hypothetical protein